MGEPSSNGVDAVLEAVASSRRRRALDCLRRHDELALADLAEQVTVRESERPLQEIPAERVTDVYFSLYHNHVPTLEQVEFVSYHQERDLVTYQNGAEMEIRRAREELATLLSE